MTYEELFIDKDDVLLIRKELVRVLGDLNEAVVLNQLHYWININKKTKKNEYDDKYWVFNTYQMWKDTDFDFWSTDTIKRTFTRLEKKGVVISANYNKMKMDKTKWYSIDYKKLQDMVDEYAKEQNATYDNADCVHDRAKCTDGEDNSHKAIPEITPENTDRDYNTETPKGDTLSFDNDKADTMTFKKSLPYVAPKKSKAELKELEQDMINRFCKVAQQYDVTEVALNNIINAFKRYLCRYTEKTNKVHPILKDDTLDKIFIALATIDDEEYEHYYGVADYEVDEYGISYLDELVDEHFKSEHQYDTDYHISHFANSNYLSLIAQHIVEY